MYLMYGTYSCYNWLVILCMHDSGTHVYLWYYCTYNNNNTDIKRGHIVFDTITCTSIQIKLLRLRSHQEEESQHQKWLKDSSNREPRANKNLAEVVPPPLHQISLPLPSARNQTLTPATKTLYCHSWTALWVRRNVAPVRIPRQAGKAPIATQTIIQSAST